MSDLKVQLGSLALDEKGHPILLAVSTAPGVDVPGTESGNPAHIPAGQPGGGRFGKRNKVDEAVSTRGTAGVTQEELSRRLDAVREAAREFEVFNEQDVKEWLKGRINKPFTQAEVDAFLADVRSQQLTDLVDVLDQNERGMRRGRRFVRVTAPKGYQRKLLGALTDLEIKVVAGRLKARGWNTSQLKGLVKRLPVGRRDIVLEDVPSHGFQLGSSPTLPPVPLPPPQPPPVVVQAPPRKKKIVRDRKGLITSIEEE